MPITLSYDLKGAPPNQRNYIRSMFERFGWQRLEAASSGIPIAAKQMRGRRIG
jgi:hypothetical protein